MCIHRSAVIPGGPSSRRITRLASAPHRSRDSGSRIARFVNVAVTDEDRFARDLSLRDPRRGGKRGPGKDHRTTYVLDSEPGVLPEPFTSRRTMKPTPMRSLVVVLAAAACAGVVAASAYAATQHVSAGPGSTLVPRGVTVNRGDTVSFHNAGGFHGVAFDAGRLVLSSPSRVV